MADYIVKDTELTSVANAIRTAGGTNSLLSFPNGFVSAVNSISGGGSSDFSTATVTFIVTGEAGGNTLTLVGLNIAEGDNAITGLIKQNGKYYMEYEAPIVLAGEQQTYAVEIVTNSVMSAFMQDVSTLISVTGEAEVVESEAGQFIAISGDCTITAEAIR